MTRSAKFLYLALALGVLLRAALFFLVAKDPGVLTRFDQQMYIDLAGYLANHLDFASGFGAERVPLYPVFLALCNFISENNLLFAVAVQNLLGLATIFFLYKIGRFFSRDAANLAAGFAAVNLNMVVYSNQMLTESIFYPLFAYSIFIFFQYKDTGEKKYLYPLAFAWGVCTLIRSVTLYIPVFMVVYLLLERSRGAFAKKTVQSIVFVCIFFAVLAPWVLRNCLIYGHAGLTSQGGTHMVGWIIPSVARYEEGLNLDAAMKKHMALWKEKEDTLARETRENPFSLDKAAKEYAVDYLRAASPVSAAKAWAGGAVKNLFAPVGVELAYFFNMDWTHFYNAKGAGLMEQAYNFIFHNKNKAYSALLISGIAFILIFRLIQLFGAGLLCRQKPGFFTASLLITAYFLIISGPVGYAKYRLPYEPILVLLTALAISKLSFWTRKTQGKSP